MNSLVYLVRTEIKNRIKELRHKPGKLILYLLLIGLVVGALVLTAIGGGVSPENVMPPDGLKLIYFGFLTVFVVISIQKGLTSGDAIFGMNDVNLLFVSPLNSRIILMYGLVRLAGVAFWGGFFILFQSSSAARFGVDFQGLFVLFFLFMVNTMLLSLLSVTIYSMTNGRPRRKWAVKIVAVLVFVPLGIYCALQMFVLREPLTAVLRLASSPYFALIPFAGWTTTSGFAFVEGNFLAGAAWLFLLLLLGAGMVAYLMLSRSDYYEDVLVATETAFEKKRAVAEGNLHAATASRVKVSVKGTGVGGAGASVFFFKHLRETFREARWGFFSTYTIIMFASFLAGSIFLREKIELLMILQILMWMEVFMIGTGRGMKELFSHYIYMVPASSFKKVVWSNLELAFKTLVESLLFLALPGVILSQHILLIIAVMLTYTLFSFLLLGINYLSMRVTGSEISQGLLMMIYLLAVILIMVPGVVPALIFGMLIGGLNGKLLGLFILAAWELVAALICFALSKNVLHNTDMPVMKSMGKS